MNSYDTILFTTCDIDSDVILNTISDFIYKNTDDNTIIKFKTIEKYFYAINLIKYSSHINYHFNNYYAYRININRADILIIGVDVMCFGNNNQFNLIISNHQNDILLQINTADLNIFNSLLRENKIKYILKDES